MKVKITNWLLFLCGLLFWWQARLIVYDDIFNGAPFELGRMSLYLSQVLIFIASALLIIDWYKKGSKLVFSKYWYWSFISLIVYFVIRTNISSNLLGYSILLQWLGLLVFIFALVHSQNEKKTYWFYGLIGGGAILAIWAWGQWLLQTQFASSLLGVAVHLPNNMGTAVVLENGKRIMRAYAGLPHPNILGGYLALLLLVFINNIKTFFKEKAWLNYMSLVLLTSGLMLSFSRSAILGLIIGLAVSSLSKNFVKENYKQILTVIATMLVIVFSYQNLYLSRVEQSNYLENKSVVERVSGYGEYQKTIGSNWLFGFGFGGYQLELKNYYPKLNGYEIQPIHNSILFLVAQVGVIGLVLLFVFLLLSYPSLVLLAGAIIIALFDHYLMSLYFGLMMLSLLFVKFEE